MGGSGERRERRTERLARSGAVAGMGSAGGVCQATVARYGVSGAIDPHPGPANGCRGGGKQAAADGGGGAGDPAAARLSDGAGRGAVWAGGGCAAGRATGGAVKGRFRVMSSVAERLRQGRWPDVVTVLTQTVPCHVWRDHLQRRDAWEEIDRRTRAAYVQILHDVLDREEAS